MRSHNTFLCRNKKNEKHSSGYSSDVEKCRGVSFINLLCLIKRKVSFRMHIELWGKRAGKAKLMIMSVLLTFDGTRICWMRAKQYRPWSDTTLFSI